MDLTVSFFSTKYMNHVAACPSLPRQMKVQFGSMDDLPCYNSFGNQSLDNDEDDRDLDPQECSGSNGVDDLSTRNPADGIRHGFDANATANQTDKQSEQSQEHDIIEPRNLFLVIEGDHLQEHFSEADLARFNPDDAIRPIAYQADTQSERNQDYDILEPRKSFFLIEDDHLQEHFSEADLARGNPDDGIRHSFDANATASSTANQAGKQSEQSQEYYILEPRKSCFVIEDDSLQKRISQVDHSDEESDLPMTRDSCKATENRRCDQDQPYYTRSPPPKGTINDTTGSSSVKQIEVDLFTPSSSFECRNDIQNKKRKVASARAEVIDLTRSPDFVQL